MCLLELVLFTVDQCSLSVTHSMLVLFVTGYSTYLTTHMTSARSATSHMMMQLTVFSVVYSKLTRR